MAHKRDLLSQETRIFEASEELVIKKSAQIYVGADPRIEAHGKSKRLTRKSIGIGRDRSNGVIVADDRVTRFHAMLTLKKGTSFIRDIGSTNGTTLNGTKLAPNKDYKIKEGDVVVIGTTRLAICS